SLVISTRLQEETDAYSSSRTLSRGVNPTAALFFCAIFIADLHGIATRALSVSVFLFFRVQNKKNRPVEAVKDVFPGFA
ncbi:hypothetical protein SMA57_28845, partial [Escherichia coli]|uniref:hypothetical protein n=1 Tax=Escherichia coli TaxID=562 RepID=UPI003079321F